MPKANTANVTPEIRKTAFELSEGGVAVAPSGDGNGYVAVKLVDSIPGDASTAGAAFEEFQRGMIFQYGNDVLMTYQAHLHRELEVGYNEALINQTLEQLASGRS